MSLLPFSLGVWGVTIVARPSVSEVSLTLGPELNRKQLAILVILGASGCRLDIIGIARDPSRLCFRALPTVMEVAGRTAGRSSFTSMTPLADIRIVDNDWTIPIPPACVGRDRASDIAHFDILTITVLRVALRLSNPLTSCFPSTTTKCLAHGNVFFLGRSFVRRSSAP